MKNYLNIIIDSLKLKLGISDVKNFEFKGLPYGDRNRFNLTHVIGNKNLIHGRFKTEQEVEAQVEEFLTVELP